MFAKLIFAKLLHGGNKFSKPLTFAKATGVAEFAVILKFFSLITLLRFSISAMVAVLLQLYKIIVIAKMKNLLKFTDIVD
jgi:hypothetical protein